jgi:hypothetical protein
MADMGRQDLSVAAGIMLCWVWPSITPAGLGAKSQKLFASFSQKRSSFLRMGQGSWTATRSIGTPMSKT